MRDTRDTTSFLATVVLSRPIRSYCIRGLLLTSADGESATGGGEVRGGSAGRLLPVWLGSVTRILLKRGG